MYAADTGRNRILVFGPNGALLRQIGRTGTDLGGFTQPMMLAFAPDGSFFVADWENSRIERWDASFEATDAWSTGFRPFGVGVDQLGRVYVPDTEQRRVEVVSAAGRAARRDGRAGLAGDRRSPPGRWRWRGPGSRRCTCWAATASCGWICENTPPPPQGGADVDVVSLAVIAVLIVLSWRAVLSRAARARRREPALLGTGAWWASPAGRRKWRSAPAPASPRR